MNRFQPLLDKAMRAHVEAERAWWMNDRRGRWVVLEPGPGQLLTDSPRHIREYIDAITSRRGRRFSSLSRRGRRFSSLSRARAFARTIGGEVRRWHRQMPRRFQDRAIKATWHYETNPWKQVVALRFLGVRQGVTE